MARLTARAFAALALLGSVRADLAARALAFALSVCLVLETLAATLPAFGRAAVLRAAVVRAFLVLESDPRLDLAADLDRPALALADFVLFLTDDIRGILLLGSALETERAGSGEDRQPPNDKSPHPPTGGWITA